MLAEIWRVSKVAPTVHMSRGSGKKTSPSELEVEADSVISRTLGKLYSLGLLIYAFLVPLKCNFFQSLDTLSSFMYINLIKAIPFRCSFIM